MDKPKIGKTYVATMQRDLNALRKACRAEGTPAVQDALDRAERWFDCLSPTPTREHIEGMVKPLEWEDFEGRGAKASGWRKANYLITLWSDGRFELVESYPGYSGNYIARPTYPSLEAAKAAAQADYTRRIFAALGLEDTAND